MAQFYAELARSGLKAVREFRTTFSNR